MERIKVGIADYKIATAPHSLVTLGLGSCVGIALYNQKEESGSLLHIMLPDSSYFKETKKWEKFADLAIPKIANELSHHQTDQLVAKIAGGASLFNYKTENRSLQIGKRNIEMVKKSLDNLSIPILGEHVGGDSGRSMLVDLETFDVTIRMVNREIHHI